MCRKDTSKIGVLTSFAKSVVVNKPITIQGIAQREDMQRHMAMTTGRMLISSTTPRPKRTSPGSLWEICEVEGDFGFERGVMLRFSSSCLPHRLLLTHMLLVYDGPLCIILFSFISCQLVSSRLVSSRQDIIRFILTLDTA